MNATDPFEAIVGEHYDPLYRFALSLTCAQADAQDLTQQAFYTWATKGHQLRDRAKIKTWLFTTLHRLFLAGRRRENRFPHCELDETSQDLPTASLKIEHMDSSQVLSALRKLDDVFQPAVALFYLEDYSYKEIADFLEVPIGTVKSRIARGLVQLRDILFVDRNPSELGYARRDLSATQVQKPIDNAWLINASPAAFGSGI